ncbi:MAG: carboxypeptidase-like regulatory domain-containing protein [Ignavibacteriales bacterium]|nr:carboxypeptidase-like regulatory domain-containing protein [Ignavibacteriales bacterium]
MHRILFIVILLTNIIISSTEAQQFPVSGRVLDKQSGEALQFATIRVLKLNKGTTTNVTGDYTIKLSRGNYTVVASFMGYVSDTLQIAVTGIITDVTFRLLQADVHLPPVTVFPGENPAVPIIRQAIKRKKQRAELLKTYEYTAYTKVRVKTTEKLLKTDGNEITLLYSGPDTSAMKLGAIFENQSQGFRKGKLSKEIIVARKQTANLPSYVNTITGGRIMQDFNSESVQFLNRSLTGPLADNGLAYYYYRILDSLAIDSRPVYKLLVTPDDSLDPGFTGELYIAADNFDLLKVVLGINKAADKMGITDSVHLFQQYTAYGNDEIMMPADYRMDIKVNFMNIIKVGFDVNTVLSEYQINQPISDGFFDMAAVTVRTDADKKDSVYWSNMQVIPATTEEILAYKELDSVENAPKTFWQRNSWMSDTWSVGKHHDISAPLGMYNFNRVEGHTLGFSVFANELRDNRLKYSTSWSYGFSDRKWKGELEGEYKFGEYRTTYVQAKVFKKTPFVMDDANYFGNWINGLLTLCLKSESNHYYYSDGFSFKIGSEIFPVLSVSTGFNNHTDKSGVKNTDFSFFRKNDKYKPNERINDLHLNELMLGFQIDFRDYMEDGLQRRRMGSGKGYILISGEYLISDKKLGSEKDFTISRLKINGRIPGFKETSLSYVLEGVYANKGLPWQKMIAMQGGGDGFITDQSFRTFWVNEFFGDRTAELHFNYNFSDTWLRATDISFLKQAGLGLTTFFSAALLSTSNATKQFSSRVSKELLHPLYEAGFGLSYPKFPMSIEFAWRINYREGNRFKIGVNAVMR